MKFLVLAYGAEADWNALTSQEQDELLAADSALRARGDTVAAVEPAVRTVRSWTGTPIVAEEAVRGPGVPLAGFGIIEAPDWNEAIALVANTPCARANGAVELRKIANLDAAPTA